MDSTLLDEKPRDEDINYVHRDIIYCLCGAFSLTHACKDIDPAKLDNIVHDALLEASLLNIRNLDNFIARKGNGSEITLRHLRMIGFATDVPRILTQMESRLISQMFAHITANRNVKRLAKKGFPLTCYLETAVSSFDPILQFFEERSKDLYWESDNIRNFREHLTEMLEWQKTLDKIVHERGLIFYISGNNLKVR